MAWLKFGFGWQIAALDDAVAAFAGGDFYSLCAGHSSRGLTNVAAHVAIVKTVLQEVNQRISDQIANSTRLQQAMHARTVDSFYRWKDF